MNNRFNRVPDEMKAGSALAGTVRTMPNPTAARITSIGTGILRAATALTTGLTTALTTALTTPLRPEDYLALVNPLWSARERRGRVEQVTAETDDTATLVIRPGSGWGPHRAGQWVSVGVAVDGVWRSRCYSITSPAGNTGDGLLRITVKAVADGHVSHHLVHRTPPGAVLRLGPARGEFVLPDPVPERLLFITAGAGITPVMGMLRTLVGDRATPNATPAAPPAAIPDVMHVHCARHADDVIFGTELRALPRQLPGYRLHERHTRRDGRLTPAHLHELCPDWRRRPTWACGPTGMLTDLEAHWNQAGARERLHLERFAPTPLAAPDTDGGTVSFTRTRRDAAAPAGTPLLRVGEQAGVAMPSGCRIGICFSCVAPLRRGQVRDLRTGQVHGEQGDLIQTCISGAAGPCAIDL